MIRPVSKTRSAAFLNDYQVLKGQCPKTMKNFGEPVSATHEAELLIKDDRNKMSAGEDAWYVIHQRSENRIVGSFNFVKAKLATMPVRARAAALPLPQAA